MKKTQLTTGNSRKREMGKATGAFMSLGTPSWGSVRICGLPGGAECTVGNKAPAYFGTIPRTRLFLGVLISSAHWEEKNNLKVGEKKRDPPPPRRQETALKRKGQKRQDDFLLNRRSTLNDKHFWAQSSEDLVTIVTVLLYVLCLLTQR